MFIHTDQYAHAEIWSVCCTQSCAPNAQSHSSGIREGGFGSSVTELCSIIQSNIITTYTGLHYVLSSKMCQAIEWRTAVMLCRHPIRCDGIIATAHRLLGHARRNSRAMVRRRAPVITARRFGSAATTVRAIACTFCVTKQYRSMKYST